MQWNTYPFLTSTVQNYWSSEWISNFIPHFTEYVITYPCWDLSRSMSVKRVSMPSWTTGTSLFCIVINMTSDALAMQGELGISSHDVDLILLVYSDRITRNVNWIVNWWYTQQTKGIQCIPKDLLQSWKYTIQPRLYHILKKCASNFALI